MPSPFINISVLVLALIAIVQFFWTSILWALVVVIPLIAIGIYDSLQSKHSIRRNYPVYGHGRWFMEALRPYIRQYLVESDSDGAPINRMFRNIVYQRAKNEL